MGIPLFFSLSGTSMTKAAILLNAALFVALSAVPIVAEYVTAVPGDVPGTGFNVLCYEPFDFAYILFASALFLATNVIVAQKDQSLKNALLMSICISLFWVVSSFVMVAMVHHSLGGTL